MRILQVCPKYYPAIGGVEEYVKNISERLAKEHELTVFACSDVLQRSGTADIRKHFWELIDQSKYLKQFLRAQHRRGKTQCNSYSQLTT